MERLQVNLGTVSSRDAAPEPPGMGLRRVPKFTWSLFISVSTISYRAFRCVSIGWTVQNKRDSVPSP